MSDIVCAVCEQIEEDKDKIIICAHCHNCYHLKCKGFVGNSGLIARRETYFCSQSCANIHKGLLEIQMLEGESFRKSDKDDILAAIQQSQDFLSDKFDSFQKRISQLEKEKDLLQKEVSEIKSIVYKLEQELDKRDRTELKSRAIIFGLPYEKDENLPEFFNKFSNVIGSNITSNDIVSIERLYKPEAKKPPSNGPPPVKVFFKDENKKNDFMDKKIEYGVLTSTEINPKMLFKGKSTKISIREEMTPYLMELQKEMNSVREKLQIKYIWPGRNGVILVKKSDDGKIHKIKSRLDVRKAIHFFQTQAVEEPMDTDETKDNSIKDPSPKRLRRQKSKVRN